MLGGVSRATIYNWRRRRAFPPPIPLSDRTVAWRVIDVQRWIDSRGRKAA